MTSNNTRLISVGLALFLFLGLWDVQPAQADGINWRATKTAFVDSIYRYTLNRAPRSTPAFVEAVRRADLSTPSKRWAVYKRLASSKEFKQSFYGRQQRLYRVYRKTLRNGFSYYASKGAIDYMMGSCPGCSSMPVNYNRAMAYVTWLNTFCSGPYLCRGQNSSIRGSTGGRSSGGRSGGVTLFGNTAPPARR